MSRSRPAILLAAMLATFVPTPAQADEASAEAVLRDAGLRRIHPSFVVQEEIEANDIADGVGKIVAKMQAREAELSRLRSSTYSRASAASSEASRLRSEATRVTTEYNSQTKQYEEKRTTDEYKLSEARRKEQEAESIRRESYPAERALELKIEVIRREIQGEQFRHQMLMARAQVQYESIAARPEIKAALRELNRGTRPKLALGPIEAYRENVFRQSVDTMAALGYRREADLYWLTEDGDFIKRSDQAHVLWREVAMHERRLAPAGQAAPPATARPVATSIAPGRPAVAGRPAAVPGRPGAAPAALLTAAQVADKRTELVLRVRDLRRLADALQQRRDAQVADVETRDSLEEINRASSRRRQAKIGTRPGLKKAIQDLEAMERAMKAETISLTRAGSALKADAQINDKPASLEVDPAAEWVKIPDRLAAELGIRPAPDARTVAVTLADGGTAQARRATIRSIQLGSATAEGVECLVLPPGPGEEAAVLGRPALTRVVAEIDAGSAALTLTRVEPPPSAAPR